jgi:hypothetical protein
MLNDVSGTIFFYEMQLCVPVNPFVELRKETVMKKLVAVFAVLAVLGMASTSLAGLEIQVIPQGSPYAGLDSYLIRGVATGQTAGGEELLVNTISGISLHDGAVHQVWANALETNRMTPEIERCAGTFWKADWTPLDTHRLIDPDHRTEWGIQPSETNSEANEAGLPAALLEGPAPFQVYGGAAGVGDYGQPDTDAISLVKGTNNYSAPQVDILQVVLLEGTSTLLDIRLLTNDPEQWQQFRNIPIPIPEPSTWILLAVGALCLLGYRLRK